jgi:hypothetical protein
MKMRLGLAVAVGLLAPLGAHAQNKATDDVVVTGRTQIDARMAQRFVSRITSETQGQIAKFDAAICPVVTGFTPPIEEQISARIRKVVKAVGLAVAADGCKANVLLVASAEGSALVRELRSSRRDLFIGVEPSEIDHLIARDALVRSWTANEIVNEDGRRFSRSTGGNAQDIPSGTVNSTSVINPSSMRVIDAATIVIDSSALQGKTVTQIADYVVMRALAKTRPVIGNVDGVGTILVLFDPKSAPPPPSMTGADLAYLKAIYTTAGNRTLSYQLSKIANDVRKASEPGPAEAR